MYDSQNAWGSRSFSVGVTQPNLPPDVDPIANQSVSAGAAFLYDVRASDPNGDPLTYSLDAASLALGMTIAGRVTVSVDTFGRATRTAYNRFGEVVETRRQSRDSGGQPVWLVSRTVYDSQGRVTLQTDQNLEGTSDPVYGTQTVYDNLGRAVRTIRREGVAVTLDGGETAVSDWKEKDRHFLPAIRGLGSYDDYRDAFPKWEGWR